MRKSKIHLNEHRAAPQYNILIHFIGWLYLDTFFYISLEGSIGEQRSARQRRSNASINNPSLTATELAN